jgi:hypothetical protein
MIMMMMMMMMMMMNDNMMRIKIKKVCLAITRGAGNNIKY